MHNHPVFAPGSGRDACRAPLRPSRFHPVGTTVASPVSTNNSTSTFASYAFGHSENETRRLPAQSRLFNPATRRLLVDAGLAPGMRMLDVGSGAGDVAMLASDLVGPRGDVVGIDSNPLILETARKRAAAAGLENVTFIEGDITKAVPDGPFDAAVGRCVLFFVADPAAALRRIVDTVRPGGIVAFHEPGNASLRPDSRPPSPLLDRAWDWIIGGSRERGWTSRWACASSRSSKRSASRRRRCASTPQSVADRTGRATTTSPRRSGPSCR